MFLTITVRVSSCNRNSEVQKSLGNMGNKIQQDVCAADELQLTLPFPASALVTGPVCLIINDRNPQIIQITVSVMQLPWKACVAIA